MLKPNTQFYADYDEDTASYCVFDTEDGKAWRSYATREQAEQKAEEMTKAHLNAHGF